MILVITGGSGSLGRAILAEQDLLASHGITRLRIISRDEQKQMNIQRSYQGEIPLDCFLGDVSDRDRMHFALKDAHFIIHAAAQKHVEKFERDIPQGYKTNIQGTQNVADAFMHSKNAVSGILVSTDKACLPITPYGVSKLAAEHLWLWYNSFQKGIRFGVCRYGNVFGSKGSVIETWSDCIKKKKTLQITDKECTRFFIELPEAAKFVVKSLFKNSKPLHIPKMKSTNMLILAKALSDKALISTIGMRSAEKIHEILEENGIDSNKAERFSTKELKEMYQRWLSGSLPS